MIFDTFDPMLSSQLDSQWVVVKDKLSSNCNPMIYIANFG
jgi:hypothetical protein